MTHNSPTLFACETPRSVLRNHYRNLSMLLPSYSVIAVPEVLVITVLLRQFFCGDLLTLHGQIPRHAAHLLF